MPKKNQANPSINGSNNASDHWKVVRRMAKQCGVTPGEIQRSWSKVRRYLETFRADYRKRRAYSLDMIASIQALVSTAPPAKEKVAKRKPAKEKVETPIHEPAPMEVNLGRHTLVVSLEGDPGRLIDLLLAVERVKSVTVRK